MLIRLSEKMFTNCYSHIIIRPILVKKRPSRITKAHEESHGIAIQGFSMEELKGIVRLEESN